jgi:hypothetical protein
VGIAIPVLCGNSEFLFALAPTTACSAIRAYHHPVLTMYSILSLLLLPMLAGLLAFITSEAMSSNSVYFSMHACARIAVKFIGTVCFPHVVIQPASCAAVLNSLMF